jgi:hypothetical protein
MRGPRATRSLLAVIALASLWSLGCRQTPESGQAGAAPTPSTSAASHRAGLVVVRGDGSVEKKCVTFGASSITGYQLVQLSAIPSTAEFYASQKSYAMCSFRAEGCKFPDQKCFCQPNFWSYWLLRPKGWESSSAGVSLTTVTNGVVQGFRWGNGSVAPPPTSFKDICH